MAINEQQVHAAAAAIDAEGKKPNASSIRERLGSGSFSTILKHLSTWEPGAASVEEGPDSIPDAPSAAIQAIWATAYRAAWISVQEERQKEEAHNQQLQKENNMLAEEIDRIGNEYQRLNDQIEITKERAKDAELDAENQRRALAAAEASMRQLEQERDRLYELIEKKEAEPTKKRQPRKKIENQSSVKDSHSAIPPGVNTMPEEVRKL